MVDARYPDLNWDKQRVKRLRKKLKMKPTEFAAAVGATRPSIDNWEAGRNKPRDAFVIRAMIDLEASLA